MVARKYTAKRLYSGGSNNKKQKLQASINELLSQLDSSSNEPYIKALKAALLFIQSAIESKTITKEQKNESIAIVNNLKTTKPPSNNKSSNMGSEIQRLFEPKNLSMKNAAKVVNTAKSEVANPTVASNINIKTNLQSMFNNVTQTNKNNLMSELNTVDLNQDSIKDLFTGRNRNEQLKLLATLLQLTGKDIPQVGGTNQHKATHRKGMASIFNAIGKNPKKQLAHASTTNAAKPINPLVAELKARANAIQLSNSNASSRSMSGYSWSNNEDKSTPVSNVLSSTLNEPSLSNVSSPVLKEPSKSSNNTKNQQMINTLRSILTPEFIKELVAMIPSQAAGGKTKSKKNKRRISRKKHVNRRNKRSNKKR